MIQSPILLSRARVFHSICHFTHIYTRYIGGVNAEFGRKSTVRNCKIPSAFVYICSVCSTTFTADSRFIHCVCWIASVDGNGDDTAFSRMRSKVKLVVWTQAVCAVHTFITAMMPLKNAEAYEAKCMRYVLIQADASKRFRMICQSSSCADALG